jgi:chemosensory pili system protein ChpE/L-lysine exporter family protein LysE/ArgO
VYLLRLAWSAWQSSRAPIDSTEQDVTAPRRAMQSGIALSLTNPQNVACWAAIGSALRGIGITEPTIGNNMVFFAVFMTSSTIWAVTVSALIDRVFRRVGDGWTRLTYRACAIALLVLALALLRELANSTHPGTLGTWHLALTLCPWCFSQSR